MTPKSLWVTAARIGWLLIAIAVLVLLVPELAASFEAATHACSNSHCSDPQIPARAADTLRSAGISLDAYAGYNIALILINVAAFYALAVALMARRSSDRMVLLTAFVCVLFCTPGNLSFREAGGVWAEPSHILDILASIAPSLYLYLFPNGRFVPRWTIMLAVGFIIFPYIPLGQSVLTVGLFFGFLISIIALQIYRYRHISTPIQQQQTKLVVLGIGAVCGIFIVTVSIFSADADIEKQAIPFLLVQGLYALAPLCLIVCIGLAILRHRLWDVDVFINRTLIYLVLTASLVLVYLGSVVGLQTIFRALTGQQSDLAVVISTLVIAALFNPLRHRIQDLIARTFYRRKYDAAQILTAFGATCRDETDLETLQANLLRVVEETMQPNHVSLWMGHEKTRTV